MARIVVVDDDSDSRDLLLMLLGHYGHRVVAACDGAQGLAQALAERPDLIITDMVMPEMDGYELTRRVRAEPVLAQTQVIFYTATYLLDDIQALAAEYGVSQIIAKPAEPAVLLEQVRAALAAPAPMAHSAPANTTEHEYMRLLMTTLHRKIEELKAEVQARERAETALQQANAELERRVHERTAEISAANLQLQQEIAERQRAETFLSAVLQQLPLGVVIAAAPEGYMLLQNDQAARMFGYTAREQMHGVEGIQPQLVHPDGRPYAAGEHPLARVLLSNDTVEQEELIYRRADGLIATFLANAAPIRAADGQMIAAVGTFHDISSLKLLEASLAHNQARLAGIIASAMDAIITVDDDQRITIWNAAAEQMFGCPAATALGQTLDRFIATPDRARHREYIRSFGRTGITNRAMGAQRPLRAMRADGVEFPIEASISQVQFGERHVYTVILRDITARIGAETALRKSEERFAKAFRSSPVAMVISTLATGRILDVNECFLQLFGRARAEVLDQESIVLNMWANSNDRARAVALIKQQGVVHDLEVDIRAAGGVIRAALLSADMLELGGEPCIITSIHDISERKRAEHALHSAFAAELSARQTAEALQQASQALAYSFDQDTTLATLLEHLERLVPYDSANVMLLEPNGKLRIRAERGYLPLTDLARAPALAFDPMALPHLRELIEGENSVLVTDTRFDASWRHPSGAKHVLSWFGVPLIAGGALIGLCSVDKGMAGFFTPEHVLRAEALSAQAAVAIQNARMFETVRQSHTRLRALSQRLVTVQEAERRSIARELHDEIGQTLTGLRLMLEMVSRLPPDRQAARLDEAHTAVQELITRVRSLSLDLRPAMLDDLGLLAALLWHFRRYTEQTGIVVECRHRGLDGRFPTAVETVAYRVVQEALTNAARHAGVAAVNVWLLATQAQLSVRIADAGRGFEPGVVLQAAQSSGLLGMQERVALLGGSLSITSTPGMGTQVLADLPLAGADYDD